MLKANHNPLTLTETKGDVSFYNSPKGIYQQLGVSEPYKVKDGKPSYRYITSVAGYTIKYHNNGCNGFTIFRGKTPLEDNIWKFADAERICRELSPLK